MATSITALANVTLKTVALTTFQKIAVTAALTVTIGGGIYAAKQAHDARNEVQTLQARQAPMLGQIRQMTAQHDKDTNTIAWLQEELAKNEKNNLELLKLRGEVGVLRYQLEWLKLVQSAALIPNAAKTKAHRPGTYISKDQLNNAGSSTPEAAFETQVWALLNGNYEQMLEGFTPQRKEDEIQRKDIREDFSKASQLAFGTVKGVQILAKKLLGDGRVELKIKYSYDPDQLKQVVGNLSSGFYSATNLPPDVELVAFVKIGDEWKEDNDSTTPAAFDAQGNTNGQVQTYTP